MHDTVQKLVAIENKIRSNLKNLNISKLPKIIAVSKTFKIDKILPLIDHGHIDFGENKVQEAVDKWTEIKKKKSNIKLHMIGKLQTNKVKFVVKLFDYIHSVDSEKLAKKIFEEQIKINKSEVNNLVNYCKKINLDVIGLMCIPPVSTNSLVYFKDMNMLNNSFGFSELSMGMSSDYLKASENLTTFLRIGSGIFGKRF